MSDWRFDDVPAGPMALWCEVLGDDNPIHVDPAVAEALGFGPRTVNPGPTNLAYLINMVLAERPDAPLRSIDAALLGNVLAGDTVLAHGEWDGGVCRADLRVAPDRVVVEARIELGDAPEQA